jgi:hypothetical protein
MALGRILSRNVPLGAVFRSNPERPGFSTVTAHCPQKFFEKGWSVTVIVRTFLRYSSMSDIFGLAYLVGQIED